MLHRLLLDLYGLLLHPTEILLVLLTLAILLRVPFSHRLAWVAAPVGVAVFALTVYWILYADHTHPMGNDIQVFWKAGAAVWDGKDPYTNDENFINPPTALPVYATLAALPFPTVLLLWTLFNALGYLVLVVLAQRTQLSFAGDKSWQLPAPILAVLMPTVALSLTSRYGLELGQLSVFIALILLAALHAQNQGRPILAGFFLALGTAKTGTLIPFLLLFLRRRDLLTWIALPAFCLLFCLLTTPPLLILERCRECLHNIAQLSKPGEFNDYSFGNSSHAEFLSLDHAFYCLGLRDRRVIALLQLATLATIGAWLVFRLVRDKAMPRAAAVSLVACYSCIFLYHRFYDLVILVLPLAYAAGRALREQGRARWLYTLSVVGLLALLYFPVGLLRSLSEKLPAGPAGRLVAIVVLPYAVWGILGVMVCLTAAERWRRKAVIPGPVADSTGMGLPGLSGVSPLPEPVGPPAP